MSGSMATLTQRVSFWRGPLNGVRIITVHWQTWVSCWRALGGDTKNPRGGVSWPMRNCSYPRCFILKIALYREFYLVNILRAFSKWLYKLFVSFIQCIYWGTDL